MTAARPRRRPDPSLVRIALVLLAFLLGVHGFSAAYAALPGSPNPLGKCAFRALQLVIGHFPADLDDRPLPWTLQLARWALPLLTFWTTATLAWRQVRNPVRLRWLARRGGHLVLHGDAGLAARLARAPIGPAILWTDDPAQPWVDRAADAGLPHVAAAGEGEGADQLGLARARAVLLVGEGDTRNIALAGIAAAAATGARPAGNPLAITVRVDHLDLRASTEARYAADAHRDARLRVVSLPDIAARALFLDHPLDAFRRVGSPERVVFVLGLTPAIERYVLRLLAAGHFRDGGKPKIVVLAPDAAAREAVFRARRPGADVLAPVVFEPATDEPALVGAALDAAVARHGPPVALLVDTGEESRTLALAHAVEAHLERGDRLSPPIHARLSACTDDQLGTSIRAFGAAALGDPEMLLGERHDELARAIHDFYLEGRLTEGDVVGSRQSMREWEDLPESVRDDNRLVGDCYRLKLRDIGARLTADPGAGLRLSAAEVEDLSRAEHDRWAAAKLIDGWVHGDTRDDAAKRHPDLIPYDALTERIRDLDREQIRLITRLLPDAGLHPRRALVLTVARGRGPGRGTLADGAGWLAEHYPDRVPVWLGRADDPIVRDALAALPLVQAAVRDGALDPAARRDARALLRRADTVWVLRTDADLAVAAGEGALAVTLADDGSVAAAPWIE